MYKQNPLLNCDSYKLGHGDQYPLGTTLVYSNFTPRSNAHLNVPEEFKDNKMVFFGLQAVLKSMTQLWNEGFFNLSGVDAELLIQDFGRSVAPFVGPKGFNLDRMRELYLFGKLPIEVRALPEGSRVNIGVPVFIILNTDPRFYWITNYLETWLSCEIWKLCNSATLADCYKKILVDAANRTGAPLEFVQWQGHDFSMRGMSNIADAAASGAGHLLSFNGTDSLPAVAYLEQFYEGLDTFVGGSVPATEHSVMSSSIRTLMDVVEAEEEFAYRPFEEIQREAECRLFKRFITEVYPAGIVSIVSDTFDFWNAISVIAPRLKDDILARTPDALGFAKVVFRPDSGDPVEILCGLEIPVISLDADTPAAKVAARCLIWDEVVANTPHGECGDVSVTKLFKLNDGYYEVMADVEWNRHDKQFYYIDGVIIVKEFTKVELTAEQKGAVEALWDIFGGTVTDKGFKVLDQHVGLIYGDSITPLRAAQIMRRLEAKGFASCNTVLGIGSYTYQYNTRDTLGFAMKATYCEVDGKGHNIFKSPKTDSGMKKSARGLLKVVKEGEDFKLLDCRADLWDSGLLKTIYRNGTFLFLDNIANIRARLSGLL